MKAGEYLVEYVQNGKLYVNVDGGLIRILNPYDHEPQKVKLAKVDGKIYIDEFAPKKDKVVKNDKENVEEKPQVEEKDTYKSKPKHK